MSALIDLNNCTFPGSGTFGTLIVTGITSTAVDYAALPTDEMIVVTASAKIVTLPTAVGIKGKRYTVKLTVAGITTIATTSAQTIDGAADCIISGQFSYLRVISDGANWLIFGGVNTLTPGYSNLY